MNIDSFRELVTVFYSELQSIPEEITSVKLTPEKWSLKEIVGHLVDSASNNHHRFIRLQEVEQLTFPGYNQQQWNSLQHYNDFGWYDLLQLWTGYNKLLLHIISHIDKNFLNNVWLIEDKQLSLEWIINDYYRHVKHHFDQFKQRSEEILNLRV